MAVIDQKAFDTIKAALPQPVPDEALKAALEKRGHVVNITIKPKKTGDGFFTKVGKVLTASERTLATGISQALGSEENTGQRIQTFQTDAERIGAMAKQAEQEGDWERAARLYDEAKKLSLAGGAEAEDLQGRMVTSEQIAGGALGTAADIVAFGKLPAIGKGIAKFPATTFLTGAKEGAIRGAQFGGSFGGIQGLARGMQANESARGLVGSTAEGLVTGAVVGGAVGGVTGGISGALRGRAERKASERIEQIIKDRETRLRSKARLTVDVRKDPITRKAIDVGVSEQDARKLRALTPEEKGVARRMYKVAEQKVTEPWVKDRPLDVAGQELNKEIKYINKVRKEVGVQIGKAATSKNVPIGNIYDDFTNALDDLGVTVNMKDGVPVPDFEGSGLEMAPPKVKEFINYYLGRLHTANGTVTEKSGKLIIDNIDELIFTGQTDAQNKLSGKHTYFMEEWRRKLSDAIAKQNPEIRRLNPMYSVAQRALKRWGQAMGKDFNIYEPGALDDIRAGELLARTQGNSRGPMAAVVRQVSDTASELGYKSNVDKELIVEVADMIEDYWNIVQPRSLQGQAARAAAKGQEALGVVSDVVRGNKIGLVTRALRSITGTTADAVKQAIWALIQ